MTHSEKSATSQQNDGGNHSDPDAFSWAVPIMRAGYGGRGLVYLVIAGVSLWSIFKGGNAEGTKSAMQSLDGALGVITVVAVAAGMFAYCIWRFIDSYWDLEDYGTSAKGIIARIGMLITGLIHAAIGVIAITALGYVSSGSEGRTMLTDFLQSEVGSWMMAIAGIGTIGTGFYYIYKAVSQSYREHLQANHFTIHWNPVLRMGLVAQGVAVIIIGGLIAYAGLRSDSSSAGGLDTAFNWLGGQIYGNILVVLLCVGLLGFSLFCFVNAVYRIIPKASDPSIESLSRKLDELSAKA